MTQIPRAVAIALSTIVLLIVGLSLYAVQQADRSPTATAVPATAIPTVALKTPTDVAHATAEVFTTATQFKGGRAHYSVIIPAGWAMVDPAEHSRYLGEMENSTSLHALTDAIDLLAYDAQNGAGSTTMTIAVAARNGLGLHGYLAAIVEELTQIEAVATQIDHALRADGLPAGVVSYTAPGAEVGRAGAPIFTQQVVLMDDSSQNFIIITFAAAVDQVEQMQPQWRTILQSITFN